jgi:hypothetical protein
MPTILNVIMHMAMRPRGRPRERMTMLPAA